MTGIYDCFGYGKGYDVTFEERYRLIKSAGFACVMLWWSDKFGRGSGYQRDVRYAKNAGYCYDSCHHQNYAPEQDLLKLYGKRLSALHLQDNGGRHN